MLIVITDVHTVLNHYIRITMHLKEDVCQRAYPNIVRRGTGNLKKVELNMLDRELCLTSEDYI